MPANNNDDYYDEEANLGIQTEFDFNLQKRVDDSASNGLHYLATLVTLSLAIKQGAIAYGLPATAAGAFEGVVWAGMTKIEGAGLLKDIQALIHRAGDPCGILTENAIASAKEDTRSTPRIFSSAVSGLGFKTSCAAAALTAFGLTATAGLDAIIFPPAFLLRFATEAAAGIYAARNPGKEFWAGKKSTAATGMMGSLAVATGALGKYPEILPKDPRLAAGFFLLGTGSGIFTTFCKTKQKFTEVTQSLLGVQEGKGSRSPAPGRRGDDSV
jgi:hypothetical protein